MHFLLTEDASGLLQSTIFERCYRRFGHMLYETDAYLLEGMVQQDEGRGFSFMVDRISSLGDAITRVSEETSAATRAAERRRRAG